MNPAEQAAQILRLGHDHGEAIGEVVHALVSKAEAGTEKHGVLNLADDRRDFYDEAIGELQDCIWYAAFQIVKLRRAQRKAAL